MTPSWFATFALLTWPVVALWLFSSRPISQAILWTILAGQLLLPVGADIKIAPGIPQFDKTSIPNLAALLGCILVARGVRFWYRSGIVEILLVMSVVGPFVTSELNGDQLSVGGLILPSVGHYDALSAVVAQFLMLLPFFLGRQFLRSSADNVEILRALVVAGLLYSPLVLFEIRMSPQLHYWLYGYYSSGFIQAMRDGGFRPMVFMGHGLALAFFMMTTTVAAAVLWRAHIAVRQLPPAGVTAYFGTILVLCKSMGALIYAFILVPLVRLAPPRLQLRIAVALVLAALLYPALRTADLFPTDKMVAVAAALSTERAASLAFRFRNEDQLLARASQRILFGWGRFGRSRIYNESGRDISTTDGRWIITLGQFGLFGFIAEFGLLAFSVLSAASALRFADSPTEKLFLAALALIVAVNVIDLLPNSGLTPWTWLLAGALIGRAEALRSAVRERELVVHQAMTHQAMTHQAMTNTDAPSFTTSK